jgi:amino acid permease
MVAFSYHTISIFPVFVFAFTCAQNMLPVYNELLQNHEGRVNSAIVSSIGTGACVYLIVGVLGYLSFGSNVGDNIIAMYPSTSLFVCLGRVSIIVLTLFSYPLQVHPCRASLDKVFSRPARHQQILDAAASASLLGSDACEQDGSLEPYQDDHDADANGFNDAAGGMYPLPPASASVAGTLVDDDDEIPLGKWCLMTAGILSTTFVISLLVDDLSIILGFVGSVGSTTISFILPGVLYASLFADEPRSRLRTAALVLAAWGCGVLVVALSANVVKLMHAPAPESLNALRALAAR